MRRRLHAYRQTGVHIYIDGWIHTCIQRCIYIHIHTDMHAFIHTHLSSPKPGHTTGGSGRGARRGGGVGWAGRDADRTVRPGDRRPSYPPRHRRHVSWTSPQKHEQPKSYVNRWGNTATGWQAVDKRFIRGTKSALCSWLLTSGPTPFCLCKPFSCKACPGTFRPAITPTLSCTGIVNNASLDSLIFIHNPK